MKTWEEIKQSGGSEHYKTGGIEPIDLYRAIKPHESLSALGVKALTDNIKYSARMLKLGFRPLDCAKIINYTELFMAENEEKDVRNLNRYTAADQLNDIVRGKE
jgi:hypothetical protein